MPVLSDEAIFKSIKNGEICPVYFLYGAEVHFVSSCVSAIIKKVVGKNEDDFSVQRFDGDKISINSLEDALEAMPLFSLPDSKKCVLLKDVDMDKLGKDDYESIISFVKNPNETTVFIIYATGISYDFSKSARIKKLIKEVSKIGATCEFAYKDKSTIKKALCAKAKKSELVLEMQTAEFLINRCSLNYTLLLNELDKLISYAKGCGVDEITKQSVIDCCMPSIEATSFDLAKAMLNKNYERAFLLLDELFFQRIAPIAILSALSMTFLDLYRASVSLSAGKNADDIASDFGYAKNRIFVVRNALRDIRGFSTQRIRECLDILLLADKKLKSSSIDNRLILEQMLASMI